MQGVFIDLQLETGRVLDEFEVETKTYPAPGHDLVVMHLRDEEAFLAIMSDKHEVEIDEMEFVEDEPMIDYVRTHLTLNITVIN